MQVLDNAMPPTKRKAELLTGRATRQIVRRGSGGEHEAVVLRIKGGDWLILQRRGGNPFSDPKTAALVGHRVEVKGFRVGDVFRYFEAVTY